MKLLSTPPLPLFTDRLELRLPKQSDYRQWSELRQANRGFLEPWEPTWTDDHLSKPSFAERVRWSQSSASGGTGLPLLLVRQADGIMVGGITLDQIRLGPAQKASVGYWVGEEFSRRGYMQEAINAVVWHAFEEIGLSRVEAACLPSNVPSRRLLEKTGFKYEGVAQSYLQIHGRWRNHVLYANLRSDRRGRTDAG